MNNYDIYICHDKVGDAARLLSAELRYRGYRPYCRYNDNKQADQVLVNCQYVLLVLSDRLFEDGTFEHELRMCRDSKAEIVPVCLSSGRRGFPAEMHNEFSDWRSLQVSVISEDDLFEKSMDKLIQDRFSDEFKEKHHINVQSQNGLCLNTLRLVDIIRKDDEALDSCLYRVFNRKIDEKHFYDWDTLD